MKVLLVRPKPDSETIGLQHVMVCEPLELEYLYSNIPEHIQPLVTCVIYDFIVEKKSFLQVVKEEKPDLVAFTGYITHVNTIKAMAGQVKAHFPEVFTAVGGVHAEVVGDDFLDDALDFIYRKNGILCFNATLEGWLNGHAKEAIAQRLIEIEARGFFYDYKYPNRLSVSRYREKYYYMFHNPCALIKTSYGCPYNCRFCFCKEITKGQYFARDIVDVVDEIQSIIEDEIYIVDDDFLFDSKRIWAFVNLLKERGIKKHYLVYGRADFIAENPELMAALKSVGLRAVIVGIESIRKSDLESYNKRTNVALNEKCISILNKLSIELYATLILPLDFSKQDFKDMTQWLVQQNVTFVNLQPLTPLPGTDIFETYEEALLVPKNYYEWFDMAHVILKPKYLSIRQFYIQMLLSYYKIVMRPKNTLRLIRQYGIKENIKMLLGSQRVTFQYLMKIIRGHAGHRK